MTVGICFFLICIFAPHHLQNITIAQLMWHALFHLMFAVPSIFFKWHHQRHDTFHLCGCCASDHSLCSEFRVVLLIISSPCHHGDLGGIHWCSIDRKPQTLKAENIARKAVAPKHSLLPSFWGELPEQIWLKFCLTGGDEILANLGSNYCSYNPIPITLSWQQFSVIFGRGLDIAKLSIKLDDLWNVDFHFCSNVLLPQF